MWEAKLYVWTETQERIDGCARTVVQPTWSSLLGVYPTQAGAHDAALGEAILHEQAGLAVTLEPWGWEYRSPRQLHGRVRGVTVECLPVPAWE